MYLYAGITKLIDPSWTAGGFLQGAKTWSTLFHWFASPGVLPVTNFLNEWGLALIGIALILGVFVRLASYAGILLMILYYLPILQFPHPTPQSYIVDQHIIFILALAVLASFRAGRYFGLEKWCVSLPMCKKFPALRAWFG